MTRKNAKRVTRADVAKIAGTSEAVVSYVMNNGPKPVAESTRQRVLDAVIQTGYRPNAIARALASGSTRTYGLIVPNISNPFVALMAHVLLQESMAHGHVMLLGDAGDDRKRELEVVQGLLSRQVDGLFYNSVDRHPYIDVIKASGTPFVVLDSMEPQPGVSMLRVDEQAAARKVTAHLLSHGYQQVGMISGPFSMPNARDRILGWREAMAEAGLTVDERLIVPANYTREGGYRATCSLIEQKVLPRALFASNEGQAIGCVRALAEHGLRVPEDVALVGFNGTEQSQFHVPALTTVCQSVREMAQKAISMLEEWNGKEREEVCVPHLVIGESCGCKQK